MGISSHPWDLHQSGGKDASRHKEKLKEAFRERLTDIISEENIITSDGGKKIKVPIRSLDSYRFIFDRKSGKHAAQGDGSVQEGDVISKEKKEGAKGKDGKAGEGEGEEYYEAEIELAELIEMMLEDLNLPRLEPKKQSQLSAPEYKYTSLSRKGAMSNLAKKKSLIENIKRNAKQGMARVGDIKDEDLRYRTWREYNRPITSAVVIAMMDVSASMGSDKKYLARSFFFWMVNFLRQKYEDVEIVFISHTTQARICTEYEFFYQGESGGTAVSSAYKLALDVIDRKYDPNEWNIYTFHFSDGDTFGDEDECVRLLKQLSSISRCCGYGEIALQNHMWEGWTTLFSKYKSDLQGTPNFVQSKIMNKEHIWPTLRKFLSEEFETGMVDDNED